MRVFALLLNVALLGCVVFVLMDEGLPDEFLMQVIVSVFILTPIFSIYALLRVTPKKSESLLSLYFQRKKLEEKTKLEKLQKSDN